MWLPESLWLPALLIFIAGVWLFSGKLLYRLGSLLETYGSPVKADALLVLSGDRHGDRIVKGAELVREGYAPAVIVSNGNQRYGRSDGDLATDFAIRKGYPPELFISTSWIVHSTKEEAPAAIDLLRSMGARKVILVTTTWHTARVARIFRRHARRNAPEMIFYMVGADDPDWHNGYWWKDRAGQKLFFLEAAKTIADFLGI